jgi:HAD superfamily hydrolase (TIGR01509 family)
MDPVDGIGFDLDHTLAIDNRLERVAFLRLLERLLADGGRSVGTYADEIDAIDQLLARQRRGQFSIDIAVETFVASHGLVANAAYVDAFRAMALDMVDAFVLALPGVGTTLRDLRERGIRLAILTNGWSELQHSKADRAGFNGKVLVSSEIGELKPSRSAFERLLEELGTEAARTWYVGDSPETDIAGAHNAGLGTVWFDWEGKAYPSGVPAPQHRISCFDELLSLLPNAVPAS